MDELTKNLNEVLAKSKDGFTCYWVGQALAKLSAAVPQVVADELTNAQIKALVIKVGNEVFAEGYENYTQDDNEFYPALIRAALQATPVQAQEPVCSECDGRGFTYWGEGNPGNGFDVAPEPPEQECCQCCGGTGNAPPDSELIAPVQPVAVPDGWPTDEMVVRGAEQLHDCLRSAGIAHDFDADLKGTEIQQDIAESVFKSMLEIAAPAAQGDASYEALVLASDAMADAWSWIKDTEVAEAFNKAGIAIDAAIAAKAAS